jgi:hypothetical protein
MVAPAHTAAMKIKGSRLRNSETLPRLSEYAGKKPYTTPQQRYYNKEIKKFKNSTHLGVHIYVLTKVIYKVVVVI